MQKKKKRKKSGVGRSRWAEIVWIGCEGGERKEKIQIMSLEEKTVKEGGERRKWIKEEEEV